MRREDGPAHDNGRDGPLKIFKFLKGHGINFLIALVLLFMQANCELTLPGLMSNIVDVGISQGGIESAVPDQITESDLADVELFLDKDVASQVDAFYSGPDAGGVRTFVGSDDDRAAIESEMAEAEMLVYQINQGIAVEDFASAEAAEGMPAFDALKAQFGDTIDLDELVGMVEGYLSAEAGHAVTVEAGSFAQMRAQLVDSLGDQGDTIIEGRAIEYVKDAYRDAGLDLNDVQTSYLFSEGLTMPTRCSRRSAPSLRRSTRRRPRPRSRATFATSSTSACCRSHLRRWRSSPLRRSLRAQQTTSSRFKWSS